MSQPRTRRPRRGALAGTFATVLATVLLALTAFAGPAAADSYDPQRRAAEARAAKATQSAAALSASIDALNVALDQAVLDLQASKARLPIAQAEVAAAKVDLERSQREATLIAARLKDARAQESAISTTIAADAVRGAQLHVAVGQMARRAYKGQTAATALATVLDSKNAQDFVNEYGVVATALRIQTKALRESEQAAAADLNSRARLAAVRHRVTDLKADADQKVAAAVAARASAAARETEIKTLIASQAANQRAITSMMAKADAEAAKVAVQRQVIGRELAGILAKQRAAAQAVICAAEAAARRRAGASPSARVGTSSVSAAAATLPSRIGSYRGEQITNAAQIVIASIDLGLDSRGQVIAVMTAIGESTLHNVDHGDAVGPDSRGLFQQRDNGAWGSYSDRMNPRIAATSFGRALLRVPGWHAMPPTIAAHTVQRNADPYYYAKYWNDAVLIVGVLSGDPELASKLPSNGGC
ncbi:hypothetical protein [Pengzhenrongella sp.]|jgi:hypothetical protein|uniref:coiled-coil domain-containing protein n=1 Tax=Pengzhenrongella sp. TaxID=2888820 RepID=UPI002F93A4DB